MCVSAPYRVTTLLSGTLALAEVGGAQREISLTLLPAVQAGDYVLVRLGHAVERLDPEEAEARLSLFVEAGLISPAERALVAAAAFPSPA
jgi:hydrogenase expression/formation protein HypC